MFSPRSSGSRSTLSPFTTGRTPRTSATGRRSVSLFTPQKRSQFSHSQKNSQNKSLQNSLFEDTTQHHVESFGLSLPVLITEALTLADRALNPSVKIDPSGWAWLVCGRHLYMWRYKPTQFGKTGQCKELTLPPSGLSHTAELVILIPPSQDQHSASCIAVTPEGIIRYWANISHEGSFVEICTDMKGEECTALLNAEPYGCILATTTSKLLLLTQDSSQNSITYRPLQVPQGMLAGFSRRMSSFIFGGGQTQTNEEQLVRALPGEMLGGNGMAMYLLTERHLQKWLLSDGETEKLLYQCDVENLLRECLAEMVWSQDMSKLPNLKIWLVDMQVTSEGILLLSAAVNTDVSAQIHYVCATLATRGLEPTSSFTSFVVSGYSTEYRNDDYNILAHKILLPEPSSQTCFIYNDSMIVCQPVSHSSPLLDKVEFQAAGEQLLGAGSCDDVALFFSNNHGLISISAPREESLHVENSMAEQVSRSESSLAVRGKDLEEWSMSEDKQQRLKAAFLYSCRGNKNQAQIIVDDLFPPTSSVPTEPDSTLDRMVSLLSRELIDDFPVADPRWAESIPQDSASSTVSLIILHQIEDKQKAHDYLISFLKNVGLWDRLTSVYTRDSPMATRLLLCEHAEKLVAAHAFREIHSQYPDMLDKAMRWVLSQRGSPKPQNGLTDQDLFCREVSKLDGIVQAFVKHQQDNMTVEMSPKDFVSMVTSVNSILEAMLLDAVQYRQAKALVFQAQKPLIVDPEYLPWTSSVTGTNLRALLTKQHKLTTEQAIPAAVDVQVRGMLFQQLLSLTDILLDGYKCQLESVRRKEGESHRYKELLQKYRQDRHSFISSFLRHEQYERAASLAEKYCDFATLVQLCDTTNNQDRLQRYMTQFENQGFSDFVFQWYMEEGKRGKLLSQPLLNRHNDLREFLNTENNKYLSWLQDINTGNFTSACESLKELAVNEQDILARKKTLLSLSKLAALASDDTNPELEEGIQAMNDEQTLILHQEVLPATVLQTLGLDPDNMRVFSSKELIELYISDDNVNANEYDFKKALDLLAYVDQNDEETDVEEIRLHIWSRAILRNKWSTIDTDNPLGNNRDTLFFRLIELAFIEGADLLDFLPSDDALLHAEELGDLRDNPNFKFLVKAGYEHIKKTLT